MAGLRVEVVIESGLFDEVDFGVGALGAVAGRVGDLDKALAVEHKARPPAVGDESPRLVDLAEFFVWIKKRSRVPETTCSGATERLWSQGDPTFHSLLLWGPSSTASGSGQDRKRSHRVLDTGGPHAAEKIYFLC